MKESDMFTSDGPGPARYDPRAAANARAAVGVVSGSGTIEKDPMDRSVGGLFEELEKHLTILEDTRQKLIARIEPILMPTPPTTTAGGEARGAPPQSKVCAMLQELITRVCFMAEDTGRTVGRVQL
jgi:hypothetical protein